MTKEKKLNDLAKRANAIVDKYLDKAKEPVTCIGCKKEPEDIPEYAHYSRLDGLTPTEWVRQNEVVGKWGKGPNTFYCTKCYISAGMPLRS